MYKKEEYQVIKNRMEEPRKFLQVIMGPRQVGKTTVVTQVLRDTDIPYLFHSADDLKANDASWISNQWDAIRAWKDNKGYDSAVLVIDEIQKIKNWSEVVKKEWDDDTFHNRNIKVFLLGSSRVLLEKGLSESLMGRYEEIRMTHWSYTEMKECFGFTPEQYLFFGGYPGAATLTEDKDRWTQYIQTSIIGATINKDILMDTQVRNTPLLEQVLRQGAFYSGKLLSGNKMQANLKVTGNVDTIQNYTTLLKESGLLLGLQKYANDNARVKASIPKYQVFNNALKTANTPITFEQALLDREKWGEIFESGVGAWLVSMGFKHNFDVYYWRNNKGEEVDFVLRRNKFLIAIEVKSNNEKTTEGLKTFKEQYKPDKAFIVGREGIPIKEFLTMDINKLFEDNIKENCSPLKRNNKIIALEKETADFLTENITGNGLHTGIRWTEDALGELWIELRRLNTDGSLSEKDMMSEEAKNILQYAKPRLVERMEDKLNELSNNIAHIAAKLMERGV